MTPPGKLGSRGKALWKSVQKALPDDWDFDERETEILTLASTQADDLDRLEAVIKKDGVQALGSAGQPVVHPAVTEARQSRLAIGRLLGLLSLPDEDEVPRSHASKRAQKAARVRWARKDEMAERREAANGA